MITIHHTAQVPYSTHAMYELVNDVSAYPEFIPFCTVGVTSPLKDNEVKGPLTFAWMGIVESFVTHNILRPPDGVTMTLINGPFKYLQGEWKFTPLPSGCTQAEFFLQFEFEYSNTWIDYLLQPIFNTLSRNAMQVFLQRADECYEKNAELKELSPA